MQKKIKITVFLREIHKDDARKLREDYRANVADLKKYSFYVDSFNFGFSLVD